MRGMIAPAFSLSACFDTLRVAKGDEGLANTDNPATMLKNTILLLMDSPGPTVAAGWTNVLGVDTGSQEFARRHSEVVALFHRVYNRLLALPDVDVRNQYLEYVPTWYGALVYRRGPWNDQTSHPPHGVADRNIVNHLTGLAATFELQSLTSPPLDIDAIAKLENSIVEWRKILDAPDFDQKLASEIRADINHIEFLIAERGRFGTEPIVKAAQDLVGTSVVAMGKQRKWAPKIGAAMAGVVIFLHGTHSAVDDANGILEGVVKMWNEISEITSGQNELGPKSTPQLTTGHDEVVDAEVVDDPPESPAPEAQG